MPSGAGHDAQVLAAVTDAGMIFVPSQGGRSHRPDEWTDWPALERGANMLLGTLLRLASERWVRPPASFAARRGGRTPALRLDRGVPLRGPTLPRFACRAEGGPVT